jgi:thiol-disulfide isomerase/thioredoxin
MKVTRRSTRLTVVLSAIVVVLASRAPVGAETLRGTVRTAAGRPADGAKVWTARLWTNLLDRRETVADDQGRFTLDVRPGQWLVWASLGTQGGEAPEPVEVQPGQEPGPVAIALAEWGRLRGRLLAAESGMPIAGARFVLGNGLIPTTDEQGRFEAVALGPDGYHEAFVVAPGRVRMRVLFVMTDRPETELEVRVPRAGTIAGRVTDEQGQPIPGARVGRSSSGHSISITALYDRCDEQGRFEYQGIAFDRPTWLEAKADGYQDEEKKNLIVDPRSGSLTLDFRLARAEKKSPAEDAPTTGTRPGVARPGEQERRDVTGTVLGPGDQPIAGATVRWGAAKHSQTLATHTGPDGRFRLAGVPEQNGIVAVIAAGTTFAPAFAFVQGRGAQDVRVVLVEGRSARGVVRDDRGEPFTGVAVLPTIFSPEPNRLETVWLDELSAKTDAQGRFALTGLPVSGVKFDFMRKGLSALRNQVLELDGPDNTVTMQPGGAIRGRVVDPEGRPVRNFRILLNGSRERHPGDKGSSFFAGFCGIGLTYTSDDGTFVVKNLGAGTIQRVSALAAGYGDGVADRVQAEPENHLPPADALTIRLTPPHTLGVCVVEDGTNRPVADARVALIYSDPSMDTHFAWGYHDASWWDEVRTRTESAGRAEFPALAFNEGTLLVQAPGYVRRHLGWRDGAAEVTVTLKPEAIVTGEVVDKFTGKPLDGIHVSLVSRSGEQISTEIDRRDEGRFRLTALPEGDYTLSVSINFGGQLHDEQLTLEAGQTLTRSLRLAKSEAKNVPNLRFEPKPKEPAKVKVLKLGDSAPEFAVKTLDGAPLALKDYRGKYVLLDFWATWCGPCIEELRFLRDVFKEFGEDPRFAMISLSLDNSAADVMQFLKGKNQPWPQAFLGPWAEDKVTKAYGIEAIPAVLLVDPEGKVIGRDLRGEAIAKAVAEALAKK